jgi:hypothetical protein
MTDGGIRGGVPREIIIDGVEYEPAEGANLTYRLSGRSGPVHMAGNGTLYAESNPHPGMFAQDISVDAARFKALCALQSSGRFVSVTVTTAGNEVIDGKMKVNNDGALENNNGVVSLEMAGEFRPR